MSQPSWNYLIIFGTSLLCCSGLSQAASYQLQTYDVDTNAGIESMTNSTEGYPQGMVTYLERPFSWLRNAQNMFGSPAGNVVIQVAKELIHRSAGNSQVGSAKDSIICYADSLNISIGFESQPHESAHHSPPQGADILRRNAGRWSLEQLRLWIRPRLHRTQWQWLGSWTEVWRWLHDNRVPSRPGSGSGWVSLCSKLRLPDGSLRICQGRTSSLRSHRGVRRVRLEWNHL